jgi:hypothetical protein
MPTERLFLDIRYYESAPENIFSTALPGHVGRIFSFPKSIHPLGARIARKLREYGFVAGAFDHLYVNFTTVLPEGQCRYSPREVEERIKYIDFGLVPEKTNRLSETEKETLVCRSTFDILQFVSGERPAQLALVDRVTADIEEKGSKLEIVHKTKETAAYAIKVTYQIRPNGKQSVALIEYHDKESGQRFKTEFVKLNNYADVFALVGSISVWHGIISLKPRQSFKASLYTQSYRVPIEISIADLNRA